MVKRNGKLRGLALVLALLSGACASDDPLVPASDEPFLYLVLNQRTSLAYYDSLSSPRQLALLLTVASPLEPMPYRTARRFEMRRASDRRLFDWRVYPDLVDNPGTEGSIDLIYGNYHLPDSATAAGLGTADLRPGESYELEIETEGVVIRGQATIPAAFTASVEVRDGRRIVTWPRVPGAGGYLVEAYPYPREPQRDTVYAVPADVPAGPMSITAVDPNFYRFLTDEDAGRAGIDAGFGVFGALTPASAPIELPAPAAN